MSTFRLQWKSVHSRIVEFKLRGVESPPDVLAMELMRAKPAAAAGPCRKDAEYDCAIPFTDQTCNTGASNGRVVKQQAL